jgi:hypothetical protein
MGELARLAKEIICPYVRNSKCEHIPFTFSGVLFRLTGRPFYGRGVRVRTCLPEGCQLRLVSCHVVVL